MRVAEGQRTAAGNHDDAGPDSHGEMEEPGVSADDETDEAEEGEGRGGGKAIGHGDIEHGAMATGVVSGRITEIPTCEELVERIMAEARARLAALGC